jgi:hypothetical protein
MQCCGAEAARSGIILVERYAAPVPLIFYVHHTNIIPVPATMAHMSPVLWIRTHFFRIRIHKLFFLDSDS